MIHEHLSWRAVYVVFAATNLVVCLPIHAWLARLSRQIGKVPPPMAAASGSRPMAAEAPGRSAIFLLMLGGFAAEGFLLSSILVHMVPLTKALGLGSAGFLVTVLFGPSQVASRLVNMLFGGRLEQARLAIVGAVLLPLGLVMLLATTPWAPGAIAFVILFGLGSGLASIVGGTLPLELFGQERYGSYVGWITAARQFSSAFAPFGLTFMMAAADVFPALWINVLIGLFGIAAIALTQGRLRNAASASDAAPALGAEVV